MVSFGIGVVSYGNQDFITANFFRLGSLVTSATIFQVPAAFGLITLAGYGFFKAGKGFWQVVQPRGAKYSREGKNQIPINRVVSAQNLQPRHDEHQTPQPMMEQDSPLILRPQRGPEMRVRFGELSLGFQRGEIDGTWLVRHATEEGWRKVADLLGPNEQHSENSPARTIGEGLGVVAPMVALDFLPLLDNRLDWEHRHRGAQGPRWTFPGCAAVLMDVALAFVSAVETTAEQNHVLVFRAEGFACDAQNVYLRIIRVEMGWPISPKGGSLCDVRFHASDQDLHVQFDGWPFLVRLGHGLPNSLVIALLCFQCLMMWLVLGGLLLCSTIGDRVRGDEGKLVAVLILAGWALVLLVPATVGLILGFRKKMRDNFLKRTQTSHDDHQSDIYTKLIRVIRENPEITAGGIDVGQVVQQTRAEKSDGE